MDAELEELYQALIFDHDARPRNYRSSGSAPYKETSQKTHQASCYNPLCGDSYTVFVEIDKGRITTIYFEGHGCAVSKASLSMMTTILKGKTVDDADLLFHLFRNNLLGKDEVVDDRLGELAALTAVRNAPTRVKCALLGWEAMHNVVSQAVSPE